jgi:hypothetical protein
MASAWKLAPDIYHFYVKCSLMRYSRASSASSGLRCTKYMRPAASCSNCSTIGSCSCFIQTRALSSSCFFRPLVFGESCDDLKFSSLARSRVLRPQCGDHRIQPRRCQILEARDEVLTCSSVTRPVSSLFGLENPCCKGVVMSATAKQAIDSSCIFVR